MEILWQPRRCRRCSFLELADTGKQRRIPKDLETLSPFLLLFLRRLEKIEVWTDKIHVSMNAEVTAYFDEEAEGSEHVEEYDEADENAITEEDEDEDEGADDNEDDEENDENEENDSILNLDRVVLTKWKASGRIEDQQTCFVTHKTPTEH